MSISYIIYASCLVRADRIAIRGGGGHNKTIVFEYVMNICEYDLRTAFAILAAEKSWKQFVMEKSWNCIIRFLWEPCINLR